MYLCVKPTGGLCNFLRVVFSYYLQAKYQKRKLIVIWEESSACNGYFLNYFKKVKGIKFVKNNYNKYIIHYNGCFAHPKLKKYGKNNMYKGLFLKDELQEIINKNKQILGKYVAVHIRRTDHIQLAKKNGVYMDEKVFINFIKQFPDMNVYVATDNRETQQKFLDLFGDKIKVYTEITKKKKKLRQTSMREAIIDIFMCAGANKFLGTKYSSFSDTIKRIRKIK